jgi:hypothetical protein
METAIETAIKALVAKAENVKAPHDAMQFAQAALNLAHTAQVIKQTKATS